MAMPVLATKFFVPQPRSHAVSRPRLVDRLDAGVRAGRRLTLISAPAGFGKTALLGEWIAHARRLDPTLRVAWRVHVQPKWGSRVLGEIRHSEVQTWVSELSETKSADSTLVLLLAYVHRTPLKRNGPIAVWRQSIGSSQTA